MGRSLAFTLEPSDALLGVLRLQAALDAGRWPGDISARFRAASEREFQRLEECVRAVGVCYAELEARGVAALDRSPQSRFADVDSAMHLAACSIEVALDLDNVRVAVERGDRAVRESVAPLAGALRHVLWYAARSDLFVCPAIALAGHDSSPERALTFVDAFLAGAWRPDAPPDPPAPRRDAASEEEHEPLDAPPAGHDALPFTESTAVFTTEVHEPFRDGQEADTPAGQFGAERTSPADVLAATSPALPFDPDPAGEWHRPLGDPDPDAWPPRRDRLR